MKLIDLFLFFSRSTYPVYTFVNVRATTYQIGMALLLAEDFKLSSYNMYFINTLIMMCLYRRSVGLQATECPVSRLCKCRKLI